MSCPCVVNELLPTCGIFSCVSSWNVGVSEAAFVTVLLTV